MSVGVVQSMRDRIECMRVKPLLQPWLDGELDEEQRRRVAVHVEACRRCGLAASTYQTLKARLRAAGQPADPDAIARLETFVAELTDVEGDSGPPTDD